MSRSWRPSKPAFEPVPRMDNAYHIVINHVNTNRDADFVARQGRPVLCGPQSRRRIETVRGPLPLGLRAIAQTMPVEDGSRNIGPDCGQLLHASVHIPIERLDNVGNRFASHRLIVRVRIGPDGRALRGSKSPVG